MIAEYMKSLGLIVPATVVTMILEVFVFLRMPRTASSSLVGTMFGFLVFGLGFGFLAILVYHWVGNRWPETAAQVYFWIALGSAILLTMLALIMPVAFKMPWTSAILWTVMNFIWGLGYGWFLPQILNSLAETV